MFQPPCNPNVAKLQTPNSNVCKSRWLIHIDSIIAFWCIFYIFSYGFLPSSHIGRSWSQALCRHWTAGCGERSVGGAAAGGIPWNQRSQRPGTLGGLGGRYANGMQTYGIQHTYHLHTYTTIHVEQQIYFVYNKHHTTTKYDSVWCLLLKIVLLFDESCGSLVFQDVETAWSMLGNSRQIDVTSRNHKLVYWYWCMRARQPLASWYPMVPQFEGGIWMS
jgi:hypothetical protein